MKKGKILYHGTTNNFYPAFKTGVNMFFTASLQYALDHTEIHNGDEEGERFVLAKYEVRKDLNLFDPRILQHRMLLSDLPDTMPFRSKHEEISKAFLLSKLDVFNNDVWQFMEIKQVISLVENLGFDGHIAKEDDQLTFCIYKPSRCVKNKGVWCLLKASEYEDLFDM